MNSFEWFSTSDHRAPLELQVKAIVLELSTILNEKSWNVSHNKARLLVKIVRILYFLMEKSQHRTVLHPVKLLIEDTFARMYDVFLLYLVAFVRSVTIGFCKRFTHR